MNIPSPEQTMAVTDRTATIKMSEASTCGLDTVVLPQVSMNGTGKDQLVEQHMQVVDALRMIKVALSNANPHGRDYQFEPDHYHQARQAAWQEHALIDLLTARHETIIGHLVQG